MSTARVLIVDDAATTRAALRQQLERDGYEIVGEAGDGARALELFQEQVPDLVLLDLVLPRMHGLEVLRRILDLASGALVIAVSALDQETFVSQALEAGAVDYLTKPLKPAQVRMAVEKTLAGRGGA